MGQESPGKPEGEAGVFWPPKARSHRYLLFQTWGPEKAAAHTQRRSDGGGLQGLAPARLWSCSSLLPGELELFFKMKAKEAKLHSGELIDVNH